MCLLCEGIAASKALLLLFLYFSNCGFKRGKKKTALELYVSSSPCSPVSVGHLSQNRSLMHTSAIKSLENGMEALTFSSSVCILYVINN